MRRPRASPETFVAPARHSHHPSPSPQTFTDVAALDRAISDVAARARAAANGPAASPWPLTDGNALAAAVLQAAWALPPAPALTVPPRPGGAGAALLPLRCTACRARLPATSFEPLVGGGRRGRCVVCVVGARAEAARRVAAARPPPSSSSQPPKTCRLCSVTLPASCFHRHTGRKDGLAEWCVDCVRARGAARAAPARAAPLSKICRTCGAAKAASAFRSNARSRDGLAGSCAACSAAAAGARRAAAPPPLPTKACRRCGVDQAPTAFYACP